MESHLGQGQMPGQGWQNLVENTGTGSEDPRVWNDWMAIKQQQATKQQWMFQIFVDQQKAMLKQMASQTAIMGICGENIVQGYGPQTHKGTEDNDGWWTSEAYLNAFEWTAEAVGWPELHWVTVLILCLVVAAEQSMGTLLGVQPLHATVFRPQTNCLVKHFNETLK